MTTKRKPKAAKPVETIIQVEEGAPSAFDPPFAVKRIVIELLEEWLPKHLPHQAHPEVSAYLAALKGTNDVG